MDNSSNPQQPDSATKKPKDYGKLHKWLSEHKLLRHLALHLLIAGLWGIIYYLQKQDKERV